MMASKRYLQACLTLAALAGVWKVSKILLGTDASKDYGKDSCLGSDLKVWNGGGRAAFLQEIDVCGQRCVGRAQCAAKCMAKRGYSPACADCFGGLVSCTAAKCWMPCARGGDANAACRSCTKAKCRPAFKVCSGISLPDWSEEGKASAAKVFFDRRSGCRWPAAHVAEICRGNLAEWMAWAFFHCTPEEVPAQRRHELVQLVDEGARWAGVDFPTGYNQHVQAMRLTMDPIPSEHRPLVYYIVTALAMPIVNTYNLEKLGFQRHRSGTLWYWLRRGRGKSAGSQPPIVFCHGVGVNLLPYVHFINEVLRQVSRGRDIFLVSLPHISMRIKEDVPSSAEMVACLRDMLLSWDHTSAHFVGHSFGSIVVAWMCRNAKDTVAVATFLDPVCFLLIKPDVCYNFMYRQPETATQLLMHYFVARELYIAHSLSRNFFCRSQELQAPCMVMLSGEDSIVPAHSVRRYLTGWMQRQGGDSFRLLWFPKMGHGEMNFGPVGLAACKRIVAEMMSLEAQLRVGPLG
eukprot:symbB.v1.2.004972.t3/scaffold288.1/size478366/2